MLKIGETSQRVIDVLSLLALVIGLGLVLENGSLLPQTLKTTEALAAEPPVCTFSDEPGPEERISSFDNITFSEPVILSALDKMVKLVQWLPDNQRILVTRELPGLRQQFELFDVVNENSQIITERGTLPYSIPIWLKAAGDVLFTTQQEGKINNTAVITRRLWSSKGALREEQILSNDLQDLALAANPEGDQIAYLAGNQLHLKSAEFKTIQVMDFNPPRFDMAFNTDAPNIYKPLQMAWRPGTKQIVFYSGFGGYLFLLDAETKKICKIDIGGWAGLVRWSSNGRYMAAIRSWHELPIEKSDLAVLDVVTGKLYIMGVIPKEAEGRHFVDDLTWGPDNRHLAVIASNYDLSVIDANGLHPKNTGLYLIDFINNQQIPIFPNHSFISRWWGTDLSWSGDGSKLLIGCNENRRMHYCLIPVAIK
jgi:hypothetical protein